MHHVYKITGNEAALLESFEDEAVEAALLFAEKESQDGIVTRVESQVLGGSTVLATFGKLPELPAPANETPAQTFEPATGRIRWDDFLRKFTMTERIGIRQTAKTDPVVEDYMKLGEATGYVVMTSEETTQGLGYLAMIGLIEADRVAEILTG